MAANSIKRGHSLIFLISVNSLSCPNEVKSAARSALSDTSIFSLEALARKDLNFQTELNDFKTRRKNTSLETLSKNNQAFSGLTSVPDATGLVAQTIGLGIEKYTDLGYYTGADGKVKARGFE